jgi:protein-L-isoaspartate(D-aspartate) O-methyltransferase
LKKIKRAVNANEKHRINLIKKLRKKGIKSEEVLSVIGKIPRELFINPSQNHLAYEDKALPISCSQSISQPYTVAFMTELLCIEAGQKILEVGTGSGYQATILFMLGAKVYSVERHEKLFDSANELFTKHKIEIKTKMGDGSLGWEENSPYDSIILTAATPEISSELISQVKIGGKIVAPVGDLKNQTMTRFTKLESGDLLREEFGSFKFVPLLGKRGFVE